MQAASCQQYSPWPREEVQVIIVGWIFSFKRDAGVSHELLYGRHYDADGIGTCRGDERYAGN